MPRSAPVPRLQIYSAMVYEGPGWYRGILAGLDAALARDGFATVAEAVGTGRDVWLGAEA